MCFFFKKTALFLYNRPYGRYTLNMTNTNTTDATFISQTTTNETFSTVVRALWALKDGRFGVHTRLRLPAGSFHDEGWAFFEGLGKAKIFATRPSY